MPPITELMENGPIKIETLVEYVQKYVLYSK